jgi:hypothetical protein
MNLSKQINVINIGLSRAMFKKWDTLKPLMVVGSPLVLRVDKIKPEVLARNIGNFYGLLSTMKVPQEHWYPFLIANNLNSSDSFGFDNSMLTILDERIVSLYFDVFVNEINRTRALGIQV